MQPLVYLEAVMAYGFTNCLLLKDTWNKVFPEHTDAHQWINKKPKAMFMGQIYGYMVCFIPFRVAVSPNMNTHTHTSRRLLQWFDNPHNR